MKAVIHKWGNSLGLRIPKALAGELEIHDGSSVILRVENNKIIIFPEKKPALAEMLKNITEENLHSEVTTGSPQGNEQW